MHYGASKAHILLCQIFIDKWLEWNPGIHTAHCCRSVLCWYNRPEAYSMQLCNLNHAKIEIYLSWVRLAVSMPEQKQQETNLCRFLQTTVTPNETSRSISTTQTHKHFFVWIFKHQPESSTWHLHNITRTLHSDRLICLHAGNTCLQKGADRWDLFRNACLLQAWNFLVFC